MSRLLIWLVFDGPSWGPFSFLLPYVLGLAIGKWPHKVKENEKE
jgi:hypothetical protein